MRNSCALAGTLSALAWVMVLAFATLAQTPSPYRLALPGYHYSFPRDHFNHPAFQTEWWYYTGNLGSPDGHRFGFELTFFRQGVNRDAPHGAWDIRDLYLAHLALSDLDARRFYHTERASRAGPSLAGADESLAQIWNGNWRIEWRDSDQQLEAIAENFELHFTLRSEKPPVIHGENGVSQKAEGAGHASHYISLTRLATSGTLALDGKSYQVAGSSWMDHEFFTHQLRPEQAGWDWLGMQLDDRTELMLFHLRRKDGSIDPFSSGTYVGAEGKCTYLRSTDFVLQPAGETWHSPVSGATYPTRWKIAVPKLGIQLEASSPLPSQELASPGVDSSNPGPSTKSRSGLVPTYWEGAVTLTGSRTPPASPSAARAGKPTVTSPAVPHPLTGVGYLEMTGYSSPISF